MPSSRWAPTWSSRLRPASPPADLAATVASVPGVNATTAVNHDYAYVGPDLQDTYGIDASTLTGATTLRDSYFIGGSAQQVLARLRSHAGRHPRLEGDHHRLSAQVGDLLKLRVLDHLTGRFRVAPFHVVGVVQEFPAAPKDSFMVNNLAYLDSVDARARARRGVRKHVRQPRVGGRCRGRQRGRRASVKNISNQLRRRPARSPPST